MKKSDFYTGWLTHFAAGISREKLQKYVLSTGNLLWHVFSWELLDENAFLAGDRAKAAFDCADKENALYIEWFEDESAKPLPRTLNTADELDAMCEVYVVASDFSWTYMKTHESMCGPYFMMKP